MQKLAEICIRRPVFATMLISALAVIGAYAYVQLGVDLFPKVDFPIVTVTTVLRGASPEEVETEVTKKIEEAVNTISGIDEMRSVSTEGISQVFVTFVLERDVEQSAQDVRDKVSAILRDLPKDIDPPVIEKLDPDAAPIMSIAVSAGRSAREITEITDKKIKQQIESISGIGQVRFIGDRKRQIHVWMDAQKLQAYSLTIPQVEQALIAQNIEVPGGRVDQGQRELVLRTLGRVARAEDFNHIILANVNGMPIRVSDIGYAEDGVEEPRTLARLDGQDAVLMEVRKQSGTNTVAVVQSVKRRLAEIQRLLPPDFRMQILRDQSVFINNSYESIKEHLILGGFLAALVVLFFIRNLRSALIAAIAIPTSIISTFALMWYMGFTLNNMTMLALVLCVGIVIDDAIVVLENIFRFIEEKKVPPMQAAKEATADIGLAVMATTLSLIIIFLPVAFMSGIVGRFMKSFGLTAAFAIGVSLVVSFTLTPMLCSRFLHRDGKGHTSRESSLYMLMDRSYTAMLDWSMRHRFLTAIFSLLVVVSIVPLFQAIGKDFIPQDDQSQFEVTVRAPEGLSLQAMDALMRQIEQDIRKTPEVAALLTTVGADAQKRVNQGVVFVQLKDLDERKASQHQVMERIRRALKKYPELRIMTAPLAAIAGGGRANADLQYSVSGPDLNKLLEYSDKIMEVVRKIPGVVDVDTSLETGKPELRAHIYRDRASDLGVSVAAIASSLRTMIGGNDQATTYREGEDRYDVQLRLMLADRNSSQAISRIYVPSTKVGNVRLDNVVKLDEGTGPAQIDRYNRQRQVTVTANIERGQSLSKVLETLDNEIAKLNLDPAYRAGVQGRARELGRAFLGFALAFLLSFIFMYMILAAQFESFIDPVTILLSLPLSIPFAILSLFAFQQTINIFSALGILMLFGVVKKNSILQIDHIKSLRAEGVERSQAIRQGCRDRLRPILMTTFALVAGMLPMALGAGAGAATRRSIAIVVIGGQTLCLLLTLLVTPVSYSLFDDLAHAAIWHKMGAAYQNATRVLRKKASSFFIFYLLLGVLVVSLVSSSAVLAQQPNPAGGAKPTAPSASSAAFTRVGIHNPQPLTLSPYQAAVMAVEANREIEIERVNMQQSRFNLLAAKGAYDPVVGSALGYESRTIPVASLLLGGPNGTLATRAFTYDFSARQQVSSGGNYALQFSNSRSTTNNNFVLLDPQFNNSLSLTFTQPLLRNFRIDQNRRQLKITSRRLDISEAQFKQKVMDTIVNVQRAYWELVYALRSVQVQKDGVEWAQRQLEINKRMVAAGTLAPVEIVAAEAELQGREENVLLAVEGVTRAENQLKSLILPDRSSPLWGSAIVPTEMDQPILNTLEVDEAMRTALSNRPELDQLRLQKEVNEIDTQYYRNQAKPQVDFFATYGITGLAGTLRSQANPFSTLNALLLDRVNLLSGLSGLDPLVISSTPTPNFLIGGQGKALGNLFGNDFRDIHVGVNISLPLRNRTAAAALGQSLATGRGIRLQRERIEQSIEVEVRDALQSVRTAQKRIEAAAAARRASEQQLASETRQYEVGETTNFLVLTRQNALATARARELRALVDYNKALADLQRSMGVTLNVYNLQVSPSPMQ